MITVKYEAFLFFGFENDIWRVSSVTVHASLDMILEARSHFVQCTLVQRFRGNRLNFLPNEALQIINLFLAYENIRAFRNPQTS